MVLPVNMQNDLLEQEKKARKQEEVNRLRDIKEQKDVEDQKEEIQREASTRGEVEQPWEELTEQPVNEKSIPVDYFIDRPRTPVFIPNPDGHNVETQIQDGDPDLFDYDNEVEPILEVLTGKIIEQARIEVLEEFETELIKTHRKMHSLKRDNDLMETQRLEMEHLRREKERNMRKA